MEESGSFHRKRPSKICIGRSKKNICLAKKEKQDAQVIKALVYMTGLQSENREDNEIFSIAEIEKEIATAKEPVSSILKSLLAEMYWNYYQQHRWKLYNRTKTDKFSKNRYCHLGCRRFS